MQKIAAMGPGAVHDLDPAKAARLGCKTMYIPSVGEVQEAIKAIPFGQVKTVATLREELANLAGADISCPFIVNQYWRWLAFAAEEEGGEPLPWWRITRNGKPVDRLPGGIEAHRARLQAEGHSVK